MSAFKRSVAALFFGCLGCLFAGCSSPAAPLPPSGEPVPQGSSIAVLEISHFTVTAAPSRGGFAFETRFTLTETGGKSGATIQDIAVGVVGGSSVWTGPSCWGTPIRVPPGSSIDSFDAGWDELASCAPSTWGQQAKATIVLVVNFTDDERRKGSVRTEIQVPDPVPGGPSSAVLEISGLTVTVVPSHGRFVFQTRFILTETRGKSGATIQDIDSYVVGEEGSSTGIWCWGDQPIRVPAGSSIDTFSRGWEALGYCAPFTSGPNATATVVTVVHFTDDDRRKGSVRAEIQVSK